MKRARFSHAELLACPGAHVFLVAMTHLIRRFVSFACWLLVALTLLGCAEPLSLGSLHALNLRAYAGTICGIPKGAPSNTRFYAVNASMGKVVTDRNPAALRDFMPIADSVHEVSTWAPASSAKTVPTSMGVTCPARQELPADLVAKLNDIVATPCELPENNGLNRHYVGQTLADGRQSLDSLELRLVAGILTWALKEAEAEQPWIPRPRHIQKLETAELLAQADTSLKLEDPAVQFGAGAVAGASIGGVPFGPFGADVAIELHLLPKGTYWARVGKACGEIAVGTGQMILGCAGMSAGAGMSGTGVGAVPGVVVISGSYAIAANGCLTTGHGLADLHQLWREGDPATNASAGSSAPAPTEPLLKPKSQAAAKPAVEAPKAATPAPAPKAVTPPKPVPKAAAKPAAKPAPPKATAKPAVAEAAPAVKPARPTVPAETTSTTLFKDASGKPLKTVTKRGDTTTTTQLKSPAAQTSTPVNNSANSGTTTVYRSVNKATGEIQYVGITDAYAQRRLAHMRERGFDVERVIVGLSRSDARAVEQALIELHGLGKNGGTLLNKINSIAKTNPDLAKLLQKGYDLLKAAEYKM